MKTKNIFQWLNCHKGFSLPEVAISSLIVGGSIAGYISVSPNKDMNKVNEISIISSIGSDITSIFQNGDACKFSIVDRYNANKNNSINIPSIMDSKKTAIYSSGSILDPKIKVKEFTFVKENEHKGIFKIALSGNKNGTWQNIPSNVDLVIPLTLEFNGTEMSLCSTMRKSNGDIWESKGVPTFDQGAIRKVSDLSTVSCNNDVIGAMAYHVPAVSTNLVSQAIERGLYVCSSDLVWDKLDTELVIPNFTKEDLINHYDLDLRYHSVNITSASSGTGTFNSNNLQFNSARPGENLKIDFTWTLDRSQSYCPGCIQPIKAALVVFDKNGNFKSRVHSACVSSGGGIRTRPGSYPVSTNITVPTDVLEDDYVFLRIQSGWVYGCNDFNVDGSLVGINYSKIMIADPNALKIETRSDLDAKVDLDIFYRNVVLENLTSPSTSTYKNNMEISNVGIGDQIKLSFNWVNPAAQSYCPGCIQPVRMQLVGYRADGTAVTQNFENCATSGGGIRSSAKNVSHSQNLVIDSRFDSMDTLYLRIQSGWVYNCNDVNIDTSKTRPNYAVIKLKKSCQSGQYLDAASETCRSCSLKFSNCMSCNAQDCLECTSGLNLESGRCVEPAANEEEAPAVQP